MTEQPIVGEALLGARNGLDEAVGGVPPERRSPSRSSMNKRRSPSVASRLEETAGRQAKPFEHELGRDKCHGTTPEHIFEGAHKGPSDLITPAHGSRFRQSRQAGTVFNRIAAVPGRDTNAAETSLQEQIATLN
ncbi:MAG: hypothetical protein GY696_32680, partial [Gammaproteobacteria bacterium]|nr:hypothetical protein [Gammaproteobacteria bacterium]